MKTAHKVLGAIWVFQIVNYLDRVAISFAAPSIMTSLKMEPQEFGLVLSSFSVGYMLAQVPGGILADRWGARPLLIGAPMLWALFTGLTGLAAGLVGFIIVRACFGVSEGLSNTACFKVIGDNFTSQQRTNAVALWVTSFAIAPAFAGPVVSMLLTQFGWQAVFVVLAVPALGTALINYFCIPKDNAQVVTAATRQTVPLVQLLKQRSLWVIGFAYMCFNIAYWGYLGWMPTYLASAHHIDVKSIGWLGAIPYVFALFGLLLAGRLGSTVMYRHRPQLLSATYLLAAISLYFAYSADTLPQSLIGLSAAAFFLYGGLSPFGAIVLELAPENARAAYSSGVTTLGQIGGAAAPGIIGYLVGSSGNFASGFAFMVAALLVAAVSLLFLSRTVSAPPLPATAEV